MDTKALAFGIIGFLLGGLVVSTAATYLEDDPDASGSQMTMSQMSEDLEDKAGDDYDQAFLASMIEHHRGALAMAKLSASRAKHREIKDLSREIVAAQEEEIDRMRQWQERWGYDVESGDGHQSH
jgi:uncharacterized protein (DUF305 family)